MNEMLGGGGRQHNLKSSLVVTEPSFLIPLRTAGFGNRLIREGNCILWLQIVEKHRETRFFLFFEFSVLGMEFRTLPMLGKHSTTELHPYPRK
jgi:hypothetical protein